MLAILISRVAYSATELAGTTSDPDEILDEKSVQKLRMKWLNWCLECAQSLEPNYRLRDVEKLLTACMFAFDEWVNIGDEKFKFDFGHFSDMPGVWSLDD